MAWRQFSFQQMRMNAGIGSANREPSTRRHFLFHCTIFGVAFCIALLYQAMRPIMRLGGMVARGGPYVIEHPAPDWVWIMPVAVLLGIACLFLNMFSNDSDGVNLMALAWPALFLSLGWNFLEFAFAPPGGGFAWGWLVSGIAFVLMGGLPLLLAFKPMREKVRTQLKKEGGMKPYALQWLLVGAGIIAAIYVFRAMAG